MNQKQYLWVEPPQIVENALLLDAAGGNSILAACLLQKGFTTPEQFSAFLNLAAYSPASPFDFPDMQKAVDRINVAINKKQTIGIWGDFDVDGQTSTTVLVSGLRQLGASVQYHIPIRATESHGISLPALQGFLSAGVQLLITCDTGISAMKPIQHALEQGVETIITDHHELPYSLPPAFAIINPHLLPSSHPALTLSGAGAAFELWKALVQNRSMTENENQFLDLVALGLVADLAELIGDTRYFSHKGILALRNTLRPGLQALMQIAEIDPTHLSEEHISFGLAPRLNAIGRLDDANSMVHFFTTDDAAFITQQVSKLETLNEQRKLLSSQVFEAAMKQAEQNESIENDPILILLHAEWPPSVLGVAASRIVEITGKPAVLLNLSADGVARGSARSVEGVHITELLGEARNLLKSFGGHAKAAGLSLSAKDLPAFKKMLFQAIKNLPEIKSIHELPISAYLDPSLISLDDAVAIEKLSPFGAGNPAPVFMTKNVTIQEKLIIGKAKEHAILKVKDNNGDQFNILRWQGATIPAPDGLIDLAFLLRQSNFRGNLELQFEYVDARPSSTTPIINIKKPRYRLFDFRNETNFDTTLLSTADAYDTMVWEEGIQSTLKDSNNRTQLKPCKNLIVYSIPPSNKILHNALEMCKPEAIYFGGIVPKPVAVDHLLQALLGIVKYSSIHHDFNNFIFRAMAKLAMTESSIVKGLNLLYLLGKIPVTEATIISAAGITLDREGGSLVLKQDLEKIIGEISAYRSFYLRATLEDLLN